MKLCSRCGQVKPLAEFAPDKRASDGRVSACRECEAQRVHEYYVAHPGMNAKISREFYYRNREARLEACREYRAEHPHQSPAKRAYQKRYYQEHKGQIAAYHRAYAETHREQILARRKAYAVAHPERLRARCRQRYATKMGAVGSHSATEWEAVRDYWGRCLACGTTTQPLCEDHVVPLYRGGADDISNIQPLCRVCNASKGTKTIDYRLAYWWNVA